MSTLSCLCQSQMLLPTCVGLDVAVAARVLLDAESGQAEALGDLHRVSCLPQVSDVVCRVAV